jgi:hypothetical protein
VLRVVAGLVVGRHGPGRALLRTIVALLAGFPPAFLGNVAATASAQFGLLW